MAMRPWDVFLAQVLQFQCQLPAALTCIAGQGGGDSTDPCAGKTQVIGDVATAVAQAHTYLAAVAEKLKDAPLSAALRTSLQLGKVGEWVSSYGQLQQKITDAQKMRLPPTTFWSAATSSSCPARATCRWSRPRTRR